MRRALIDSSVWIEYYHPKGSAELREAVKQAILNDAAATTPLIAAEVARGARTDEDLHRLKSDFLSYHQVTLNHEIALRAGGLLARLDRQGRRVPIVDAAIAALALSQSLELWHLGDEHYALLAAVAETLWPGSELALRVFQRNQSERY